MKTNLKLPWRVVRTGGHITIRDASTKIGRAVIRKAVSACSEDQWKQIEADFEIICLAVNHYAETHLSLSSLLDSKLAAWIIHGAKTAGTCEPMKCLALYEELMTRDEYQTAQEFLQWCDQYGRAFGQGNIQAVYQEYLQNGEHRT